MGEIEKRLQNAEREINVAVDAAVAVAPSGGRACMDHEAFTKAERMATDARSKLASVKTLVGLKVRTAKGVLLEELWALQARVATGEERLHSVVQQVAEAKAPLQQVCTE